MVDDDVLTGLVVSADALEEGPEAVLTALLHDAAHILSWRRGVQDTTMRGSYHNARYLTSAEEVGLEWPVGAGRSSSRGFVDPRLTDAARRRHEQDLVALGPVIAQTLPHLIVPKSTSGRRTERITAQCQCDPPRLFRISASALEKGPITCGVCGELFE